MVSSSVLSSSVAQSVSSPGPARALPPHLIPPQGARRAALEPEQLHPALWRAHQFGRSVDHGLPSGFTALDAELPGGGWPRRSLTELLLPHPGLGEMRLLAPCLRRLQQAERPLMLFDPPARLSATALAALGLEPARLLVVHTRAGPRPFAGVRSHVEPGGEPLWALEQALRSGHVGGVLAWLPMRCTADRLRRLQLAAQAHDGPAFMLRESPAAARPSPAPLRLALQVAGPDRLALRLLKRRGPPLLRSLKLDLPAVLPASVAAGLASHDLMRSVGVVLPPFRQGEGLVPTVAATVAAAVTGANEHAVAAGRSPPAVPPLAVPV